VLATLNWAWAVGLLKWAILSHAWPTDLWFSSLFFRICIYEGPPNKA
jgi:hypothetical protein